MNKKGKRSTHKLVDSEHIQHAEFIKKCHLELRLNSMKIGADEAWKNHCSDESLLKVSFSLVIFTEINVLLSIYFFKIT